MLWEGRLTLKVFRHLVQHTVHIRSNIPVCLLLDEWHLLQRTHTLNYVRQKTPASPLKSTDKTQFMSHSWTTAHEPLVYISRLLSRSHDKINIVSRIKDWELASQTSQWKKTAIDGYRHDRLICKILLFVVGRLWLIQCAYYLVVLKQSNKITYKSRHLCFHKRTTPKHTTLNLPRLKNCLRWRIVVTLTSSPW